jgi:hypothetical protein
MNYIIKDRAYTIEQKKDITDGLFRLWLLLPEQRLGQLIDNSMYQDNYDINEIFAIEDFELLRSVNRFVNACAQPSSEENKQYPETD